MTEPRYVHTFSFEGEEQVETTNSKKHPFGIEGRDYATGATIKTEPQFWIGREKPERHGDWMQTFSGKQFWPMDPRADEVDIRDIAHALSMACRYAGHCKRFYSVAEHCVLMTQWLRKEGFPLDVQRWALLHDAAEAYLVDVPRPLKAFLTGYTEAETAVLAVIAERCGLAPDMPSAVKDADNRILVDEYYQNLVESEVDWVGQFGDALNLSLRCWPPESAEGFYLAEFDRLFPARGAL